MCMLPIHKSFTLSHKRFLTVQNESMTLFSPMSSSPSSNGCFFFEIVCEFKNVMKNRNNNQNTIPSTKLISMHIHTRTLAYTLTPETMHAHLAHAHIATTITHTYKHMHTTKGKRRRRRRKKTSKKDKSNGIHYKNPTSPESPARTCTCTKAYSNSAATTKPTNE